MADGQDTGYVHVASGLTERQYDLAICILSSHEYPVDSAGVIHHTSDPEKPVGMVGDDPTGNTQRPFFISAHKKHLPYIKAIIEGRATPL